MFIAHLNLKLVNFRAFSLLNYLWIGRWVLSNIHPLRSFEQLLSFVEWGNNKTNFNGLQNYQNYWKIQDQFILSDTKKYRNQYVSWDD